jgi:hypothetical protein
MKHGSEVKRRVLLANGRVIVILYTPAQHLTKTIVT